MQYGEKKTIVWLSNFPGALTGLGKNSRYVLEHLYKTGKYNIICYCMGMPWESLEFQRFPYKCVGAMPQTQEELDQFLNKYPPEQRGGIHQMVNYGAYNIDRVIKEFKPSCLAMLDDYWGFHPDAYMNKPWWPHVPTVMAITIDSRPVGEQAREQARAQEKKGLKYYTWLDFGAEWLKELGHENVDSLPGAIDPTDFYKLPNSERLALRERFNIQKDAVIFGFVFRNQLRKDVSALLDGFSQFVNKHPEKKAYVILHSHFSENPDQSWDIPKIIKDYGIDNNKVLVTHICKDCGEFEVRPYVGQDHFCRFCGIKGSPPTQENPRGTGQITTNVAIGCSNEQLNKVYNLIDFYIHLTTNGGQEQPVIEALLTEIPVALCAYSYGETFAKQPFVTSIDFIWTRQTGTNFRRSVPQPFSVYKTMKRFAEMKTDKRAELGRAGRKWAVETFSPSVIGAKWEQIIDSLPECTYNFDWENEKPKEEPSAPIDNSIPDDSEWVENLYTQLLKRPSDPEGKLNWLSHLQNGATRAQVEQGFRQVVQNIVNQQLAKSPQSQPTIDSLFGDTKKEDRILFNIPESLGDCIYITCLLEDLRNLYPDKKIFLATKPQYFEVFHPLVGQYIDSIIAWNPQFDNELLMNQFVLVNYITTAGTQKFLNYLKNGQDKTAISFALSEKV